MQGEAGPGAATGVAEPTSGGSVTSILLVLALMAVAAAVGIAQFGKMPLLELDSRSYISASGIRGLGYPAFLAMIRWIGVPLERVPWLQLLLFVATVPVLFAALRRAVGNLWLPSLVLLLVVGNPKVAGYHAQILSESVFLSLLMLFVAAFLRDQAANSAASLLPVAALAALAVTVRPAGWAFVAIVLLVVAARLVRQRRRGTLLAVAVLPLVVVIGGEHVASRVVHGPERSSLLPLHLFAKAGMVDADLPPALLSDGPRAPLHRALERDAEAIRRLVDRAPGANIARFLTVNYEVFLQYQFAEEERRAFGSRAAVGTALSATGLERLRYAWAGLFELTLRHYLSLWLLYDASHPSHFAALNAFIAAERPLPYEGRMPALIESVQPAGFAARVIRPTIAAAGVLTALLAAVGLFSLFRPGSVPPLWRQAGLLALGLHGYCLLTALAGVGIVRYLLGVWPLLVCSLGLAFAAMLPWCARSVRRMR